MISNKIFYQTHIKEQEWYNQINWSELFWFKSSFKIFRNPIVILIFYKINKSRKLNKLVNLQFIKKTIWSYGNAEKK